MRSALGTMSDLLDCGWTETGGKESDVAITTGATVGNEDTSRSGFKMRATTCERPTVLSSQHAPSSFQALGAFQAPNPQLMANLAPHGRHPETGCGGPCAARRHCTEEHLTVSLSRHFSLVEPRRIYLPLKHPHDLHRKQHV
jgi:hypothetical protein